MARVAALRTSALMRVYCVRRRKRCSVSPGAGMKGSNWVSMLETVVAGVPVLKSVRLFVEVSEGEVNALSGLVV